MSELDLFTSPFDAIKRTTAEGREWWSGRELQPMLGYDQWRRFAEAIERAKLACSKSGFAVADHFADAGKKVPIGSDAFREIEDFALTRYAAYLIAMNGDPRKPEIATAQTYFAVKTREAEVVAQAPPVLDMSTPEGRLRVLDIAVQAERRTIALAAKVAELEPDAAYARQVIHASGMSLVRGVAKRFGMRESALFAFLRDEKILIRGGASRNEPYANFIKSGHFAVKHRAGGKNPDGTVAMKPTPYITPKGEVLVWKRLYEAGLVTSPVMPAEQLELVTVR